MCAMPASAASAWRGRGWLPQFPMEELALHGLTAVMRRLPSLFRRVNETVAAVLAANPDVLVAIDCPAFSLRVARKVRRLNPRIAVVDYVSPSVWAYRPGRARAMARYVDRILAILPFEPDVHRALGGPPCTYVGHPLIARLDTLMPAPGERARLAPASNRPARPAGQPEERNQPADGAFRRDRPQGRRTHGAARRRAAGGVAPRRRHSRRCRELAGEAADRGRRGGQARGLPQRPRGAGGIGHGDARTGARRRADGGRLPGRSAGAGR